MGASNHWFVIGILGMLSYSAMTLTLKKLTYTVSTPVILLYLFVTTAIFFLGYNLKNSATLKLGWTELSLTLLAAGLAFIGNLCDVESLRLAPNAGYAGAIKAGQILVVTFAAYFLFKDQQLSWIGFAGVCCVVVGVGLIALSR